MARADTQSPLPGREGSCSQRRGPKPAESGALIRCLLANDLADEMTLLIVSEVLGQGAELVPDAGPDVALDLVESRADAKGVTIQVYRPSPARAVWR